MKIFDGIEGIGSGAKCFLNKGSIATKAAGVADDFAIKKISNGADIGPSLVDSNIGQIGYDDFQRPTMTKFSVKYVAYFFFVFLCGVVPVFCFGVDGYQVKLLHDGTDSSPGGDDVFCFQLTFYLACAIDLAACTKDGTDFDLQLDRVIGKRLWMVIVSGTADAQDSAKR